MVESMNSDSAVNRELIRYRFFYPSEGHYRILVMDWFVKKV